MKIKYNMAQYIDKSAVVAEIKRLIEIANNNYAKFLGNRSAWAQQRDVYEKLLSFLDTLEVKEVSFENPDEQMIAKYLYEKKGYPIDLNGNIPSFEETMKDVEKYNKYKEDKFIEKACKWLKENKDHPFIGCEDCCLSGFLTDEFIEEFRKAMEE